MGTAYIETTITAEEGGVTLFETECVAEIDYETDHGELADWSIRDFRFDRYEGRWNAAKGVYERVKAGEVWCQTEDLRRVLLSYADMDAIREELADKLHQTGELTYANPALRGDYHSRVL